MTRVPFLPWTCQPGERLTAAIGQKQRTNRTGYSSSYVSFNEFASGNEFSAFLWTLSDVYTVKSVGGKYFSMT